MGNEASTPAAAGAGGATAAGAGGESHEDKLRAIRQMDSTIRQRLRGGVSYNMKVVLRGERGSGKSALLARLQGLPFKPEVGAPLGLCHWIFLRTMRTNQPYLHTLSVHPSNHTPPTPNNSTRRRPRSRRPPSRGRARRRARTL